MPGGGWESLGHRQVAECFHQAGIEKFKVPAAIQDGTNEGQPRRGVLGQGRFRQLDENFGLDGAQGHADVFQGDLLPGVGDDLVQRPLAVPHGTVGRPGDLVKGGVVDLDPLRLADMPELTDQGVHPHGSELETLAAGLDGGRELVNLCGCQNENDVGGRLLQGFQEGVEGLGGNAVGLVKDIDLVFALGRVGPHLFLELPDIVDLVEGGRVDLDDVHGGALVHLLANVAGVARFSVLGVSAIEDLGEDAGGGGFPDPPGPGEDIGVGDPVGLDGVLQRPGDLFLAHHVGEDLGAPFQGHDLGRHAVPSEELGIRS